MIPRDALTAAEFRREWPRLQRRGYRIALGAIDIRPPSWDEARRRIVYAIRQRIFLIPPTDPRTCIFMQG